MSWNEINAVMSLIIIAAGSILIMLSAAVYRNHKFSFGLCLLTLLISFIFLLNTEADSPVEVSSLIIIDNYALFFAGLLIAATFAIAMISYNYLEKINEQKDEYYILLLTALLGSVVLVTANHFFSLFLGLEVLSVSLYTLIAYNRIKLISIEAGVKYLILAGISSAFLLFGIALVYNELGTMSFPDLNARINLLGITSLLLTGFALIVVGIGFKLAVVPFHMWTPDVYEGASSPVTSFIASVSKGGMVALLFRFFLTIDGYKFDSVILLFAAIAAASMIIGNLLALFQYNVKRILAYSSIAHLGYILVAFISASGIGVEAAAFYLTAYFITIIVSFGIISILSTNEREAETIDDYKGLFWRKPWTAAVFTAALFSLAGIPLTAGFIGKYFVVAAGANSAQWSLLIILVLSSVIGLYYYLRIVAAMFSEEDKSVQHERMVSKGFYFSSGIAVTGLTILLILFGVYPAGIIEIIRTMIGSLIN